MKPTSSSSPSSKHASKSSHRDPAPSVVPPPTVEDAPRLKTHRPVRPTGSSGTSASSGSASAGVTTSTALKTAHTVVDAPAPPIVNPMGGKLPPPAKAPPRKTHATPPNDSDKQNVGSSSSSMMTDKTGQRSVPPSLPLHRASSSRDGACNNSEESEAGIVESSRSYLTRLSLEDAVVALERLRFLMMSHTAAVTGSQLDSDAALEVEPPQQTHVDPFKLSKRPLEDIAEELCSQLRRLTAAYSVAAAADRCLLGVSDSRRPTQPFVMDANAKGTSSDTAPLGSRGMRADGDNAEDNKSNDDNGGLLGTFGPMVSTQHMTTIRSSGDGANFLDSRLSLETEDSWGAIDLHKPNPGPRIAYPPREDSDTDNFASTVYKYPNGTVVSYPISTFGELVSTESGQGTTFRSRVGTERHLMVSDGTQTDDTLEPTKKEKELQAYVKALEARLTDKQRLEAMRESRGAKKSGISENLSKLARTLDNSGSLRDAEKSIFKASHTEKESSKKS